MKPQVLFSLHDITPFHRDRIARAEALFQVWGIPHIAYLFVPKYHRRNDAHLHSGFRDFCRAARPFKVDWLLHGYYHLETDEGGIRRRTPRGPCPEWSPPTPEKKRRNPLANGGSAPS